MQQQTLFAVPAAPEKPISESGQKSERKPRKARKEGRPLPKPSALRARRPRGIIAQTRAALHPGHRLATLLGAVLGAFVPYAVWAVAHQELTFERALWRQFGTYLVLGGLAYSATNVYSWGRLAFRSSIKAAGFVVLLEGVLVGSKNHWLSLAALVVLAGINAIATGATLSVEEG